MPKKARELAPIEVKLLTKPGLHTVGGVAGLAGVIGVVVGLASLLFFWPLVIFAAAGVLSRKEHEASLAERLDTETGSGEGSKG